MTFLGFVEDNDVPESTRIPVYMGVQPIKFKNMFPLIVYRATGWDSYTFIWTGGGVWPKKPIFHRFASSSLGSSERSMLTPHFLFRFCCDMVPDTQILPASVLHWTRNWSNGAHWLVGFFFCFGGKSSYGVITEGCTHRIRSKVRTTSVLTPWRLRTNFFLRDKKKILPASVLHWANF